MNSSNYIVFFLMKAKKGFLKTRFAFAGANTYRDVKIASVKELVESLEYELLSFSPPIFLGMSQLY